MKHISDEEFLKKKGWKQKEAYRLSQEDISSYDGYEDVYFDEVKEILTKEKVWHHNDFELYYADTDQLIENEYEEYLDDNGDLYDEPVRSL